jgi:hypothetical protein
MTASATTQVPAREPVLARLAQAVQRERVLVLLASAAVGLHLADDNFLQPEPGTSAADHLVSGLVPLTLVVAAGVTLSSGRVRPGARAALALPLGVFGVVAGTEAAYYAHAGALSGDDYTGLLSVLAGFVLLGSGGVILWRTRRTEDRVWWRYLRRTLIARACWRSPSCSCSRPHSPTS